MCVLVCVGVYDTCTWRSGSSLQKPFLYFHPVGLRDQCQVLRFGDKCLYLLSYLDGPRTTYKNII